jgi:hypothetical protein
MLLESSPVKNTQGFNFTKLLISNLFGPWFKVFESKVNFFNKLTIDLGLKFHLLILLVIWIARQKKKHSNL